MPGKVGPFGAVGNEYLIVASAFIADVMMRPR